MEERNCFGCNKSLSEPYLCCAECLPPLCYICLNCYSKGREFGLHENRHPYKIIRNNFSILDSDWTAAEELKLLDGIGKFGIGNWQGIGQFLRSKSKEQCVQHYSKYYIDNPREELPKLLGVNSLTTVRAQPIVIKASENPPRPSTSLASRDIADYMPGRGDFGYEYDNFAELDLKCIEFDNGVDELEQKLQFSAILIYNARMKERARRKYVMRDHGLISERTNFLFSLRYCKIIPEKFEKLVRFAHLLTGDSFIFFLESLIVKVQLKQKIQQLKEYRKAGLIRHDSVPNFLFLKQKRHEFLKTKNETFSELLSHSCDETTLKAWLQKRGLKDSIKQLKTVLTGAPKQPIRKSAPPLEIAGLPGYDQLSPKEKSLCSVLRIPPSSFLQFKAILMNASDKGNGLRLIQARSLIKIDVNKTRKIFDLLIEEGFVKKRVG